MVTVAALLVCAQLALRAWVAWGGTFHDDDLTLAGRSALYPLWSADLLLYDHGGHFMPGTYVLAGLITRAAPLEWGAAALSIVLLQALASVAVLRLLRVLLGDRPVLLLPLALYLFSPLTLPSYAWWAAALNALPLQAGLAWVVAEAVLLARTGRRRHAVSALSAFALALAMFEKSVVIPWVALAVVVLLERSAGRPVEAALRRTAALWAGALGLTVAWVVSYASVVGSPVADDPPSRDLVLTAAGRAVTEGLLPPLLGGPWNWERYDIVAPWATPPVVLSVVAVVVAVVGVLVTSARRRGAWAVWLLVAGYAGASIAAMAAVRLNAGTADIVSGTLRYYADSSVVLAIAWALLLLCPARHAAPAVPGRARRLLVPAAAAAFAASSAWSTVTFQQVWTDTQTDEYLANARASLAAAGEAPLLDEPVPPHVRWGVAYPENGTSRVLAALPDRPPFADHTTDLRVLDASGRLVEGRLMQPYAWIVPSPEPRCNHPLPAGGAVTLPLAGDVMPWVYTVRIDYIADRDGTVELALETGESVRAPVQEGAHRLYVRLTAGGQGIQVRSLDGDPSLCVMGGGVGRWEAGPEE